jgi:hypothetical protein
MKKLLFALLISALIIPFSAPFAQGNQSAGAPAAQDAPDSGNNVNPNMVPFQGFFDKKAGGDNTIKGVDVNLGGGNTISVPHGNILLAWIPWLIRLLSIAIGGISVVVFSYAGINMILQGENPEEVTKSQKMIIYGIVGIVVAALSYSIVANFLALFFSPPDDVPPSGTTTTTIAP